GVPARLAVPLRIGLPSVELLVALSLLPQATAWWASLGATVLLVLFSVVLAVQLARGQTPDCHCFGQLHTAPVSGATLARNVALAAVSALLVVAGKANPGLSALNWLAELKTGEIISLVLI